MNINKTELQRVKDHNFTKELKELEYETKFDITESGPGGLEILKKIRTCFDRDGRYTLVRIGRGDRLLTNVEFFIKDNTEYSLFRYRGARMVKVKRHKILRAEGYNIFKNEESLVIDRSDFIAKLSKTRHRFKRHNYSLTDQDIFLKNKKSMISIGKMIKERVKDFVIDSSDGRIYAVAVTFCKTKDKVQKQLEVEYSGYVRKPKESAYSAEKEVIKGTVELSKYIHRYFPEILQPSIERKFEFVKRNN